MGTLAFERGASTLGQQLGFANEWHEIIAARCGELGRASDQVLRQRLAKAWIELEIMRYTALRGLTAMAKGEVDRETSISKLYWATLHRKLGELALDVLGPYAEIADGAPYDLSRVPAALPLQPGRHDLRRLERDPAQHDRRAGPRPAARAQGGLMAPDAPANTRPPTDCWAGKTVLVTAAAGTGIGFAVAKRCAEEGAGVVLSDAHERRLGEAAEQLG